MDSDASIGMSRTLVEFADARLARLHGIGGDREHLRRLVIASDFALDTLTRQPALLATLGEDPRPPPALTPDNEAEWPPLLRRWRTAESTRLIWRDVAGRDDVEATLAGSTRIAEQALGAALAALEARFAQRHGVVRDANGQPVRLTVFGLGKLGGGELNYSSDIDLVYAFRESGTSDGARALEAEDYFVRLGQALARLLGEVTADGFCHRVDLRLRPFGSAGRPALGFSAMEQYFQQSGRDWERYAWIKARPVAGDLDAGERLLDTLRPFVYRRYLDYGALDGLREMKAMIVAEVARRELAGDIKRGAGGIREIEFLAQALQLIRGGREPALRTRALLPTLEALARAGHLDADVAARLTAAYRFLRRLENRLQMLGDQQTHALPEDAFTRARLAAGLGYAGWDGLRAELDAQRAAVAAEFDSLLTPKRRAATPSALHDYWRALPDGDDAQALREAGFVDADGADAALREFARGPALRALGPRGRKRLDQVLPALLDVAARSSAPDAALPRLLAMLAAIARRSSYLALLQEQPAALARLVDVMSRSALLAERLAAHPLLLDELLDVRASEPPPTQGGLRAEWARQRAPHGDDAEALLLALNEFRQSQSFRVALATLGAAQDASDSARQLAEIAEVALDAALQAAERAIADAHGRVPDGGLAVVAYGSFGGRELGFGSDLDLVFLYDAPDGAVSDGARALEAQRWYARLAQKLVGLLDTVTSAGRLYEVDARLRPDGSKGMLVSRVASYADYQHERAWTWERQALARARAVAGDARVRNAFEDVRRAVLAAPRDSAALRADVVAMRRKMRAELDRSGTSGFDLKQGEGGLVDLEFLLQAGVLAHAHAHPPLCIPRDTPALLRALAQAGALDAAQAAASAAAHEALLTRSLACTLDRRPRIVPEDAEVAAARATIRAACRAHGLDFSAQSPL